MYSYHNTIKKRIKNGELIDFYISNNYPNISEAIVLVFSTSPFFHPIRKHKWSEYISIINQRGVKR